MMHEVLAQWQKRGWLKLEPSGGGRPALVYSGGNSDDFF
jgi:hypothetical protein